MTDTTVPYTPIKRCYKCKKELPATPEFFHRDKEKQYGVKDECKVCRLVYQSDYYKSHRKKILDDSKRWAAANPEQTRINKRKYVERHHDDVLAYHAEYRVSNRVKVRARKTVNLAVLRNELPRADALHCADCGCTAAEYHHPDYSQPMEVIPLCRSCHAKRHL